MKRQALLWVFINCVFVIFISSFAAAAPVVDKNTVALWLFDEGSGGVAKDSSANGNDGKVLEAKWVPGEFGSAVEFDGLGGKADYVEVPGSASLELTDALTIEAWVNMEEHQADNIRIVCAYDAGVTKGYSLLLNASGIISDYLNLGGWNQSTGTTQMPLGEWTHIAVTYDSKSGELKLYVNGEVDFETKLGGKLTPRGMDPVYIGRLSAADPETPMGIIDEVRISDIARTQEEIQESMKGLAGAPVEPLDKLAGTWGSIKRD
ncbi:LamG domain-containing protein [Candidatus Poribacteria bacterium]